MCEPPPEDIFKEIGSVLRDARKESGLSLSQSQKLSGVNSSNMSAYENGHRRFSIQWLQRLAGIYNRKLTVRLIGNQSIEAVCFAVIYGGQVHGVGLESENAWREAELSLNLSRETLADIGYYLREARIIKE